MAVLYVRESPEASLETYDRISSQVKSEGLPQGALYHVACKREGGGLFVVEVWENEAAQDRWSEEIDRRVAAAGAPKRPAPRKLQVHHVLAAANVNA